jgi:nucleoside-diphosphate-sugar epimerase
MSSASPACNLGALPARFRRARVLIVGCGDVGLRVAQALRASATGRSPVRVLALTSSPERAPALRAQGITPLLGNLDHAASLRRLRLRRGTPVLVPADDVYTNHIHADDLARACVAALCAASRSACCTPATTATCAWATTSTWRPTCAACRARRASPAPRRRPTCPHAAELHERIAPLDNTRLHRELRVRLRYPTVVQGLRS